MRPAIDAVRETGTAIAEVAMSYTGDLSDPGENLYTLDYYLKLAEQIVDAGAHVLAIKDMAGLLRPQAAAALVSALRSAVLTCRCTCTPTTPRAVSWPPIWRRGRPGPARSTARRHRWRVPPASPRCPRSSRRPRTPSTTPVCRCGGVRPGAVLGGAAKGVRARSNLGCPPRQAGCITTRFPAVSCPTCDSRPSRWAWGTGSRRSRRITLRPTAFSVGW